jgi:hypothetical protein
MRMFYFGLILLEDISFNFDFILVLEFCYRFLVKLLASKSALLPNMVFTYQ